MEQKHFYVIFEHYLEYGGGGGQSFDTPKEVQDFVDKIRKDGGEVKEISLVLRVDSWFKVDEDG